MAKVCAFLGNDYKHFRPMHIRERISEQMRKLYNEENVRTFLVGNKGAYEIDAYLTVLNMRTTELADIDIFFIPATVQEMNKNELPFDSVMLPPACQVTYKRWCIVRRNEWIIESTDFIIAYNFLKGRAFKFCQKAERKGVTVIDLAKTVKEEF